MKGRLPIGWTTIPGHQLKPSRTNSLRNVISKGGGWDKIRLNFFRFSVWKNAKGRSGYAAHWRKLFMHSYIERTASAASAAAEGHFEKCGDLEYTRMSERVNPNELTLEDALREEVFESVISRIVCLLVAFRTGASECTYSILFRLSWVPLNAP